MSLPGPRTRKRSKRGPRPAISQVIRVFISNVILVSPVPTVTHEFKIALQKARVAQKMTQADLAKAVAVKQRYLSLFMMLFDDDVKRHCGLRVRQSTA